MKGKMHPKLSRREMQDLTDKAILQTLKKVDSAKWTKLEKTILGMFPFATFQRFRSRMKYLLGKKLIERVQRGTYKITESGLKYLDALESIYKDYNERLFLTVK